MKVGSIKAGSFWLSKKAKEEFKMSLKISLFMQKIPHSSPMLHQLSNFTIPYFELFEGSKMCMNEVCCATTSSVWNKGRVLKSDGFATVCYNCGLAYENLFYYKTFHPDESGWRQCAICGKCLARQN